MAQNGSLWLKKDRKKKIWFLKYREDVQVNGQAFSKQRCVKLADYCDRYRSKRDLHDLVAEKMAAVHEAAKCPRSSDTFTSYVEETYLPFVQRIMKPSTHAGY